MQLDYRDTMAWQRVQCDTVQTVVSTPVLLCAADPQRVGLILSCNSVQDVYFSPIPDPAGNPLGVRLSGTAGALVLDHAHHGALVQLAWYVWSGTAGIDTFAVELIMDNPPSPFPQRELVQRAEHGMPLHDSP